MRPWYQCFHLFQRYAFKILQEITCLSTFLRQQNMTITRRPFRKSKIVLINMNAYTFRPCKYVSKHRIRNAWSLPHSLAQMKIEKTQLICIDRDPWGIKMGTYINSKNPWIELNETLIRKCSGIFETHSRKMELENESWLLWQ